jgi:hypothetical protein
MFMPVGREHCEGGTRLFNPNGLTHGGGGEMADNDYLLAAIRSFSVNDH